MEEGSTFGLFAAWLPFLFLLAFLFFFARSANKHYRQHVDEVNVVNQQIVDTNREMIAELKEIKQILKDQS